MESFARRQRHVLVAFGGGLVFAASAPPTDLQPGILLGLAAFAFALHGSARVRPGASSGFAFGLAANLLALRFVPTVIERFTGLPFVAGLLALLLLSAAQALPWAIGGGVAAWLRGLVPSWLAFAIGIYAATRVPAIFPWTPAGGLAPWPVLLQTAEIVGERGTSFLIAIACGLFADGAREIGAARRTRGSRCPAAGSTALGALVVLVLVGYGAVRTAAVDRGRAHAPTARVALVQPDFDALVRWEDRYAVALMDRLTALTKQAEDGGAILTVWPESAYPYTLAHGTETSPNGIRAVLQGGVHGPVLTGAYLSKGHGLGTNSAILVAPGGAIGPSYDKRHLLWFGETVPLADVFPIVRRVFARGTGLEPGATSVPFTTGPVRIAVLNCYEDTLPAAGREAMEVRPNLLVNVTNDAWFAGSAEGELHLRLAVLRAIETRRDLVRAVNRGPTSWIDAAGRVRARRDIPASDGAGAGPPRPLLVDAALLDGPLTLYARAGEAPLGTMIVLAVGLALVRRRRAAAPG